MLKQIILAFATFTSIFSISAKSIKFSLNSLGLLLDYKRAVTIFEFSDGLLTRLMNAMGLVEKQKVELRVVTEKNVKYGEL